MLLMLRACWEQSTLLQHHACRSLGTLAICAVTAWASAAVRNLPRVTTVTCTLTLCLYIQHQPGLYIVLQTRAQLTVLQNDSEQPMQRTMDWSQGSPILKGPAGQFVAIAGTTRSPVAAKSNLKSMMLLTFLSLSYKNYEGYNGGVSA